MARTGSRLSLGDNVVIAVMAAPAVVIAAAFWVVDHVVPGRR